MRRQSTRLLSLLFPLVWGGFLGAFGCSQPTTVSGENAQALSSGNRKVPPTDSIFRFQSAINCIYEDREGGIWMGSDREGACRFDGESFRYFGEKEGLSNLQVRRIVGDRQGNVWFETGDGICRWNGSRMDTWPSKVEARGPYDFSPASAGAAPIWKLDQDALWFPAHNAGGVFRCVGEECTFMPFPIAENDSLLTGRSFHRYWAFCTFEDSKGGMWWGTVAAGVVHFDGNDFQFLYENDLGVAVRDIAEDSSGNIWIGNNGGGAFVWDGTTLLNFTQQKGLENREFLEGNGGGKPNTLARIWDIEVDREGVVWLGSIDSGLWRYDGSDLENLTQDSGIPSLEIRALMLDREGRLWVGTGNGGVAVKGTGPGFEVPW